MKTYKQFILLIGLLLITTSAFGQMNSPSIAGRLGYPADARLLIIHGDDLGVAHSKNSASISAWEKHGINSASIMVPTPWFPEIANYARKNPEFDLGLHLTLTAEWQFYKWNGVLSSNEIPSLLDDKDYFYETVAGVAENANPEEAEKELRAQIERAFDFGLHPTHLDSHMDALFSTADLFEVFLKLGEEYEIPVLITDSWIQSSPDFDMRDEMQKMGDKYPVLVQEVITLTPETPASDWFEAYDQTIKDLEPGLNELIVHLAYDNAEMHAVTINHHHMYDAKWRQQDYDYVTSQRFKDLLEEENIQLVTWREIKEMMYPDSE